jgi:hypothetical protein
MRKLRVALYCLLGGLTVAIPAFTLGHFGWQWLSGIVLAAAFVPVALFGPRRGVAQFGVVAPVLLIVTVLCTWSEGLIFMPTSEMAQHPARTLLGALVMYVLVAAVLAVLAAALKLPRESGIRVAMRSAPKVALLVMVCGIAYLVYYYIFGGITYQFFTKAYYPEAAQLATRLGLWLPAIEFGRGVLMTLAVLPVLYTLRVSRAQAAIAVGALIWVAGGLAPLIPPNPYMGATQRFIHTIEILTQNASLGVTAALLLRAKPRLPSA